jgi:hypothetical protein
MGCIDLFGHYENRPLISGLRRLTETKDRFESHGELFDIGTRFFKGSAGDRAFLKHQTVGYCRVPCNGSHQLSKLEESAARPRPDVVLRGKHGPFIQPHRRLDTSHHTH